MVEIGGIKDSAERVIDASDLIVAPGFIHTYYDAQICWDRLLTCSWCGVTTFITGNCVSRAGKR